jgi:hypothetical protein
MIKVNAFALYRYKAAGNVKVAPPLTGIGQQGVGSGVVKIFGIPRWNRRVRKCKN